MAVLTTTVNITVNITCCNDNGDFYGGGENGHVLGSTNVEIQGGTVGAEVLTGNFTTGYGVALVSGNVFGGGMGSGYYEITGTGANADTTFVIYPTAGRVGGNTNVTLTNGYLKSSIFGGGRLALTGVNADGNYRSEERRVGKEC